MSHVPYTTIFHTERRTVYKMKAIFQSILRGVIKLRRSHNVLVLFCIPSLAGHPPKTLHTAPEHGQNTHISTPPPPLHYFLWTLLQTVSYTYQTHTQPSRVKYIYKVDLAKQNKREFQVCRMRTDRPANIHPRRYIHIMFDYLFGNFIRRSARDAENTRGPGYVFDGFRIQ